MGDLLPTLLPPAALDVLSALIPPAVVAAVFCTFVIKILRKEMAPRRMDGSPASGAGTSQASGGGQSEPAAPREEAADGAAGPEAIAKAQRQAETDGR